MYIPQQEQPPETSHLQPPSSKQNANKLVHPRSKFQPFRMPRETRGRTGRSTQLSLSQQARRMDITEPLENWYHDQLLDKLQELNPTKYRMLKSKARVSTIIQALRNLGFDPHNGFGGNPGDEQQQQSPQQQPQAHLQQQQHQQHNGGLESQIENIVRRLVPECVQAIISTQTRPAQEPTSGSAEASSVHPPESSLLSNYRAPEAPGQRQQSPWSALPLNSQTPQQSQSSQSVIANIGLSPSEGMHIHSNERNPVDHNISVLGGFQPQTSEAGVSTVWGAPSQGSPLARLRPSNGMGQDMPPSTHVTASSNSVSRSVPVSSGLRPGITNHLLASL